CAPGILLSGDALCGNVMLHRNSSRKPSNSKALMLLKCHGAVAMIRLCDRLQSWFIWPGLCGASDPPPEYPAGKRQSIGALFAEVSYPVPDPGCGCRHVGVAWAGARSGVAGTSGFGPCP